MSLPFDPLLASIVVPLAVALAIALGLPKRWSVALAYVAFAVPLLMGLHVWYHFADAAKDHGFAFVTRYDTGLSGLGIWLKLGVNGISMPLYAMAGIVGFASGWYAIHSAAERLKVYLLLLLVMQAGLMGIFSSVDVFYIYFFHELAVIPTFIMIGVWGGRDRIYAAMQMTIYLTLGAMLSLFGLIAIYAKSGAHSFDLMTLHDVLSFAPLAVIKQQHFFGCLMFGFGILVSLWPFHSWAPTGYAAAPSSTAMLHAGVLKKFGLYGLLQIALPLLPEGVAPWAKTLAVLAAFGNIIVIGLVTIAQRDLKQMVGFSSVMHMGYAFLGIACASVLGISGVVWFMVAHGLSVALLFMLSTMIEKRTGTLAMDEMGGLAQKAPVLAAFFVLASFASIGLPGFANFWGEVTIFTALWKFSHFFTAVAVAGVVISAVYGLRAAARIFFGPPTAAAQNHDRAHPIADLTFAERLPAILLAAALLFLGIFPESLNQAIRLTLAR
jgi:NADH-quinone oxidoreductase subunit M